MQNNSEKCQNEEVKEKIIFPRNKKNTSAIEHLRNVKTTKNNANSKNRNLLTKA